MFMSPEQYRAKFGRDPELDAGGPGHRDPRDLEVLAVLEERDGSLTEVRLTDGRSYRVWNIAWGYDAGDSWAHMTTNCSPYVDGEAVDFFFTSEVDAIHAPDSTAALLAPSDPSS